MLNKEQCKAVGNVYFQHILNIFILRKCVQIRPREIQYMASL